LVVLHWNISTQIGIIPYVCYEYSCLSPLLYHRNWGKKCQSNKDYTHELFFSFFSFFPILWCRQIDDYPQEDLDKFAYRADMNLET